MTKSINIENTTIYYTIEYKKNKNTYFYFRRNNTIDIKASRHQKETQIIQFIVDNKEKFLRKMMAVSTKDSSSTTYYLFGVAYQKIVKLDSVNLETDHQLHRVYEPDVSIDQLHIMYKKLESKLLLEEVEKLHDKHKNNSYVDIRNVHYKTRYTKTRFGSCNPKTRTINLNLHLAKYKKQFLEYVLLHEITHLLHPHHQKSFYDVLEKLMPNYKEVRKELKTITLR